LLVERVIEELEVKGSNDGRILVQLLSWASGGSEVIKALNLRTERVFTLKFFVGPCSWFSLQRSTQETKLKLKRKEIFFLRLATVA